MIPLGHDGTILDDVRILHPACSADIAMRRRFRTSRMSSSIDVFLVWAFADEVVWLDETSAWQCSKQTERTDWQMLQV